MIFVLTPLLAPLLGPILALFLGAPPAAAAAHAVWPLDPHRIAAGFDPPTAPWSAGHRGVDLYGSPGEQVHTALAGVVTFAGVIAGQGVVVVSHGALRTTYEPVLATTRVGDRVPTGAVIGVLEPGGHCPPADCLHWGLRRGAAYLDPLSLLGTNRVRLLPLPAADLRPAGAPAGTPSAAARW